MTNPPGFDIEAEQKWWADQTDNALVALSRERALSYLDRIRELSLSVKLMDCGHELRYSDSYGGCVICNMKDWHADDEEENNRLEETIRQQAEEIERLKAIYDDCRRDLLLDAARLDTHPEYPRDQGADTRDFVSRMDAAIDSTRTDPVS